MSSDVIIVGAGRDSLVCAAYLARAGRRVRVVEGRDRVGGEAVGTPLLSGFAPPGPLTVDGFRSWIVRDLELARHGLRLAPLPAVWAPQPEAPGLCLWPDARLPSELPPREAERWPQFRRAVDRITRAWQALQDAPAPNPGSLRPDDVSQWLAHGREFVGLGDLGDAAWQWMTGSIADILEGWFETDALRAALAVDGVLGNDLHVRSPGTGASWLDRARHTPDARPMGGAGALEVALAASAEAHGAEIRFEAMVTGVLVERGRAAGVVLEGGDVLRARTVVSGLGASRTLLELLGAAHLPDPLGAQLDRPTPTRDITQVDLALARLPTTAAPRPRTGLAHLRGRILVAPSMAWLEGHGLNPICEIVVPTLADPSLAPRGVHILSVRLQAAREGRTNNANALLEHVLAVLAPYFPTLPEDLIEARVSASKPVEGLALAERSFLGPAMGMSRYRTPLRGLWLCGPDTHPGGRTGAAGALAAKLLLDQGAA